MYQNIYIGIHTSARFAENKFPRLRSGCDGRRSTSESEEEMSKDNEPLYTVDLRQDQWDLICMSLEHVRLMTSSGESAYAVDKVARKFLRRCLDETLMDIRLNVPEGK